MAQLNDAYCVSEGANPTLCDLCATEAAVWYCAADAACLCTSCDKEFHSANEIFERHKRVRITAQVATAESPDKTFSAAEGTSSELSRDKFMTRNEILSKAIADNILKEAQMNQLLELEDDSTPEFLQTVIDLYLVDTAEMIRKLDEQLHAPSTEFSEVRKSLHKLRGGSVNIGAAQVEASCLEIREHCISQDLQNALLAFEGLKEKVKVVQGTFHNLKEAAIREASS